MLSLKTEIKEKKTTLWDQSCKLSYVFKMLVLFLSCFKLVWQNKEIFLPLSLLSKQCLTLIIIDNMYGLIDWWKIILIQYYEKKNNVRIVRIITIITWNLNFTLNSTIINQVICLMSFLKKKKKKEVFTAPVFQSISIISFKKFNNYIKIHGSSPIHSWNHSK